MVHSHAHEENYFLDQLCSVAICGGLALVAVLLYTSGMIDAILVEAFRIPVLVAGSILGALVAVRAITLWREAGAVSAHQKHHGHGHDHGHHHHNHGHAHSHDHDHEHSHDHDHSHEHSHDHDHAHSHDHNYAHSHSHGHDHGHDHDHGWSPGRYALLLLPIVLFFMGLPNKGFSAAGLQRILGTQNALAEGGADLIAKKDTIILGFSELNEAALRARTRNYFEGRITTLSGQYQPLGDKEFTLFRLKMTCCAADTIPLKVRILSPENVNTRFQLGDWVEATGQIQFRQATNGSYVTVLVLESGEDVRATEPRAIYES